jgi:hypothetical protein
LENKAAADHLLTKRIHSKNILEKIMASPSVWKLHTVNHNARNPDTAEWHREARDYPSRQASLDAACELPRHVHAEFIEGPNGERIEESAIADHCKAKAGSSS